MTHLRTIIKSSKVAFLFFALMALAIPQRAQNLVNNGSFEATLKCPDVDDNLDSVAVGWFSVAGSPGIAAGCDTTGRWGPNNIYGFEIPQDGENYLITSAHGVNAIAGCELSSPLVPGKHYRLSYWISLADSSRYTTNPNIEARLSTNAISGGFLLPSQPVEVQDGWVRYCQGFIADSAYGFLSLGKVTEDSSNQLTEVCSDCPLMNPIYYVDNVTLEEGDCSTAGIAEPEPMLIYPNPARSFIQVPAPFQLYDMTGREVLRGPGGRVDIARFPRGTYLLRTEQTWQRLSFI